MAKAKRKITKRPVSKKQAKPHFAKDVFKFIDQWGKDHDMDQQEAFHTLRDFCSEVIFHAENCDCEEHDEEGGHA